MKSLLAMLASIAVAMISWGVYGPVLQRGQANMLGSALRPFICVGLAYFLIAVLLPGIALRIAGEKGHWSTTGIIWSLVAGGVGALGALGVILAMAFRGSPVFVMPLIFGCAPVVNTFLTMYWSKSLKQINPIFIAGLILVVFGAVTVLFCRPHGAPAHEKIRITEEKDGSIAVDVTKGDDPTPVHYEAASVEALQAEHPDIFKLYNQHRGFNLRELLIVILFTAMTAVCWGVYGPTLHRGQMAMAGSRMRPLICVGLAYFLIAVLVPMALLGAWHEPGEFTFWGTLWSLAGGAAGAAGALGIIMAFNFGGKPIFVMPLVFGGAPVINTFASLLQTGNWELSPWFYAGLIVVAAGAVTVLIFAPKPAGHPPVGEAEKPSTEPAPAH